MAEWYPGDVEPTTELHRALAFLDSDLRADTVVRAGYVAAVPTAILCLLALVVLPGVPLPAAVPAAVGIGLGAKT